MSEEEIIKNINKTLEIINSRAFYEYVGDGNVYMIAITDLLNLYKQEKEKNNELEIELSTRDNINVDKLVEKYKYYRRLADTYQANCISKDKIKEKIEEVQARMGNDCIALHDFQREAKIDVLKELLEEK